MAKLIFENISLKAAKELANWYENQGEQQADDWFDIRGIGKGPFTDVAREGGYMEIKDGNVHVYIK